MKFTFLEEGRFPSLKEQNDWFMYHQIRGHLYDMHLENRNGEYVNLFEPWTPTCPQCYNVNSMVQGEAVMHVHEGVIINYYCVNCEYQYEYETVMQ